MAIYGTPLTMGGGGGGQNETLPPLLDNFKAKRDDINVVLTADKMQESRAKDLAGAVWVYGEHEPKNVNDGTKLQLTREELIFSASKTRASGKTVGDLVSKSKVKLGRYAGQELQWLVCRNAEKKLFLILTAESMGALGAKMFDNAEPSNPEDARRNGGNNRYIYSNIHQWLNSDKSANSWYEKSHNYDAPPDYTNQDGFLKNWTIEELQTVSNATWVTKKSDKDGGGTESFQSKITLPSSTEMGLISDTGGSKLDIFNSDSDRTVSGKYYWCRTAESYPSYVQRIDYNGKLLGTDANLTVYQVRPICSIPETTPISDSPDSDGCYTLVLTPPLERTVAWDKKKEFYARQFTYNSKKQYQTMLEGAIAYLPVMPDGQELSKLPSKSKVKLGKFNGTPLKWLVCRDSVDQSLRLILDGESVGVIGNKMFDNKEPNNSDAKRRDYGNNRYVWSNIRQWLNSSNPANSWYSSQHSADAPPSYTNIAGFLHEWTEKEIGVLENESWVVTKHRVDGSGTESFRNRIVLPSTTEMGFESSTGGTRIDIFNNNEDRVVAGKSYWCRTPYPSNSDNVRLVNTDGSLYNRSAYNTGFGVRPLCKPTPTTLVSFSPDSDGCYTLI